VIYVPLSELRLPDDLRQALENASEELRKLPEEDREAFLEANSGLWRRTKPCLAQINGRHENDYKCWYCETRDVRFDYHVDHFRPKSRVKNKGHPPEPGYWWLAFDCTNYRLSCAYCNSPHRGEDCETRGKWDQFPLKEGSRRALEPTDNLDEEIPLLIDPTNPVDPSLLSFADDGRVYPLHGEGFAHQKAKMTIDILNLNDVRIVEARKQLSLRCRQLVDHGNREFVRFKDGSPVAKQLFDSLCEQIVVLASRTSEFSAMARYCLSGTGQGWVLALLRVS